jgi:hypothetical protein
LPIPPPPPVITATLSSNSAIPTSSYDFYGNYFHGSRK